MTNHKTLPIKPLIANQLKLFLVTYKGGTIRFKAFMRWVPAYGPREAVLKACAPHINLLPQADGTFTDESGKTIVGLNSDTIEYGHGVFSAKLVGEIRGIKIDEPPAEPLTPRDLERAFIAGYSERMWDHNICIPRITDPTSSVSIQQKAGIYLSSLGFIVPDDSM
jgi:hypothetical protein